MGGKPEEGRRERGRGEGLRLCKRRKGRVEEGEGKKKWRNGKGTEGEIRRKMREERGRGNVFARVFTSNVSYL